MRMTIEKDIDWVIAAFAVRYALGRKTFAPSIVIEWLMPQVGELTRDQRSMIARDIREWIEGSHDTIVGGSEYWGDNDRNQWRPLLDALEGAA